MVFITYWLSIIQLRNQMDKPIYCYDQSWRDPIGLDLDFDLKFLNDQKSTVKWLLEVQRVLRKESKKLDFW